MCQKVCEPVYFDRFIFDEEQRDDDSSALGKMTLGIIVAATSAW